MKALLILAPVLLLAGCCGPSEEYVSTTKKWGSETKLYCHEESGLMMKEFFKHPSSVATKKKFVKGYNSELIPCKGNQNELTY